MNGVEYSKALSELKSNYRKLANENRQINQEQAEKVAKNYDERHDKTAKVFLEAKENIENSYNRNVNEVTDEAIEHVKETKNKYQDTLSTEKARVNKDLLENKNDFSKRLNDITDSFKRSLDNERIDHQTIQNESQKNYEKVKADQGKQNNEGLSEFTERINNKFDKNIEENKGVRKNLISEYQDNLHRQKTEDAAVRINDLGKKDEQIAKIILTNEREKRGLQENHDKSLENNKNIFDEKIKSQQNNFSNFASDVEESSKRKVEDNKLTNNVKIKEMEIDNYNAKEALKKELANARLQGKTTEEYLGKTNRGEKHVQKALESMNKQMKANEIEFQDRTNRVHESHNDHKRKQEAGFEERLLNQQMRDNVEKDNKVQRMQIEKERLVESYQKTGSLERQRSEENFGELEKKGQKAIKREIDEWSTRIKELLKNNEAAISTLKDHYGKQYKDLGIKQEKEKNQLMMGMTSDFNTKIDRSNSRYEEELQYQKSRNEAVVDSLESRLKKLQTNRSREIEYTNDINQQQLSENDEIKKDLLSLQEKKFKQTLDDVKTEYNGRIKDLLNEQDKKYKLTVEGLEDRLQKLSVDFERHQMKNNAAHRRELNGLKQENEAAVNTMKNLYEGKIAKLKSMREFDGEMKK